MNTVALVRISQASASLASLVIVQEAAIVWSGFDQAIVVFPFSVRTLIGIGLSSRQRPSTVDAHHLRVFSEYQDAPVGQGEPEPWRYVHLVQGAVSRLEDDAPRLLVHR